MNSQDVYGPRYWSVTIYQARLLFFLTEHFEKLREIKDRAESAGSLSVKKVNWEKLHVLGLLEVDRSRRSWVLVRQGPLWRCFWEQIGIEPSTSYEDALARVDEVDRAFQATSQNSIALTGVMDTTR